MANSPSSGSIGELRHGVLGSAGAAVPLAFVIAGVGSLCLASVIVRFTRRIAHADGLYAYTVRGLSPPAGSRCTASSSG